MDYKAKLAEAQAKMDELKIKIGSAADNAKAAYQMNKEEIAANIAELDAKLDTLSSAIDAQIESDIEDANAAVDLIDEAITQQLNDDIATAEGHINAARENIRLAKERSDSKLNSLKLRVQMNVNAAKAKITEKQEAHDKTKQEQRIVNLLDYADNCQQLAYAMALEAELTILEAAAEAADYAEKYGE